MKLDVEARALRMMVPGLAERWAPLELADLPTPVRAYPELAQEFGIPSLQVKQDDLTSRVCGGTKVRALEWLLGAAVRSGADRVLTTGPWGSHHARATATFARAAGLDCRLVLFPQPDTSDVAPARRDLPRLGTTRFCGWAWYPVAWLAARLSTRGQAVIPPGASSALGVLGNAEGALEVVAAIQSGHLEEPDDVLVAAGSCGTAAGLLLGLALGGFRGRVVAVRVTPRVVAHPRKVRKLARAAGGLIEAAGGPSVERWPELVWVQDRAGRGYGHATEEGRMVLEEAGARGLALENTYTAKALAHVRSCGTGERRVLFWNTFAGPRASP